MLISHFYGLAGTVILCPQKKPYQMRSFIEKLEEFPGVFSPIIILIFACIAYLYEPTNENDENNAEMMQETMKQESGKPFFLTHEILKHAKQPF